MDYEEGNAVKALEGVVNRSLDEQRKARRWGIFFKLLTFAYLSLLLLFFFRGAQSGLGQAGSSEEHVGLIEVKGVIAAEELANASAIAGGLRRAFENENCKAIILTINSPGGSPVQSGQVYDEIKRLRTQYPDKKVYAAIAELGASGAYYIAAGADEIYADKASLVGSIGVVGSGFGFVEGMKKLGVERRQYTAGEHKGFLDPFLPQNPEETEFWQSVLTVTHDQFVAVVKEGRGNRLKDDPLLFSGLVWSGEQALALGLIDGLGSAGSVARDIIGTDAFVDYSFQPDPVEQALRRLGVSVGEGIVQSSLKLNLPSLR